MIGRLTGQLVTCSPGRVLLDVAGVGYDLHIPLSTYYALSHDSATAVSLHVHTHVREEALQLFGFASRDERAVFEILIGISGVGPKLALAILSGIGAEELIETVRGQDRGRLQKIPGVGKKTAERLLLELRDKLKDRLRSDAPAGTGGDDPIAAAAPSGVRSDAISALVNLGYSNDAAGRAVDRATRNPAAAELTLEQLLRAALAGLVR